MTDQELIREEVLNTIEHVRKRFKDDNDRLNGVLELYKGGHINLDDLLVNIWNKGYMTGHTAGKLYANKNHDTAR